MKVGTTEDSKAIVAKALASVGEITTLPEVTVKIIDVIEDPGASARELYDVIKHDPALSAKLLKMANSAFYGLPGQVTNLDRAILLMGFSAVKSIAIAASLTQTFKGKRVPDLFDAAELWKHCSAVAVTAKRIAERVRGSTTADEIFLAGLIHDLGLIVERQAFPTELAEVCRRCAAGESSFLSLEEEVIGATHQDFGQALSRQWRFPDDLQAGISYHHNPEVLSDGLREVAVILNCADILCCRDQLGFELTARGQELTQELLDAARISADQLAEVQEGLKQEIEEAENILS